MTDTNYADAYYTRSNGARVRLGDMPFPHLKSAVGKLEREDPDSDELPAMKAYLAELQEAYDAEQAEREAEGE